MRKGVKQLRRTIEQATLIRCRYCDLRDICQKRAHKETYEKAGILTYCTLTPNRNKKQKRK